MLIPQPITKHTHHPQTRMRSLAAWVTCFEHQRRALDALAYDSQYTRDMCDVGGGAPPSRKNTTVVALCRRLLHEAVNCGIKVVWVKVRGHSGEAGGGRADSAATAGQNGRERGVLRLDRYIAERLGRWM